MSIYTITVIKNSLMPGGTRAVGYYETLEEAQEAVNDNNCDINEDEYYPYAVIEKVDSGIFTFPREEWWYHWNNIKEGYVQIVKPDKFARICLWSLG